MFKIVIGGAWASIIIGVIGALTKELPTAWAVFCIALGSSINLFASKNNIATRLGVGCFLVALIALVIAL